MLRGQVRGRVRAREGRREGGRTVECVENRVREKLSRSRERNNCGGKEKKRTPEGRREGEKWR